MKRNTRAGVLLASLASIVAAAGCTGSDPLNPGNFVVRFETTTQGGSAGFDCVGLNINAFRVLPLDPAVIAILGSKDIAIISNPLTSVDFAPELGCNLTPQSLPERTLPTGAYQIVSLEIGTPAIQPTGAPLQLCTGQAEIAGSYGQPLIFNVGPDEPNLVRFVLDVQEVAALVPPFEIPLPNCPPELFDDPPSILEIQ